MPNSPRFVCFIILLYKGGEPQIRQLNICWSLGPTKLCVPPPVLRLCGAHGCVSHARPTTDPISPCRPQPTLLACAYLCQGAWIRCRCAAATPAFDRLPCGVQCTVFHQTTPHFYRTTFLHMSSSWLFFALACLLAMHAESKDCTSNGTQVHVYFQQSGVILPDEAKDSIRDAVAQVASLRAWPPDTFPPEFCTRRPHLLPCLVCGLD